MVSPIKPILTPIDEGNGPEATSPCSSLDFGGLPGPTIISLSSSTAEWAAALNSEIEISSREPSRCGSPRAESPVNYSAPSPTSIVRLAVGSAVRAAAARAKSALQPEIVRAIPDAAPRSNGATASTRAVSPPPPPAKPTAGAARVSKKRRSSAGSNLLTTVMHTPPSEWGVGVYTAGLLLFLLLVCLHLAALHLATLVYASPPPPPMELQHVPLPHLKHKIVGDLVQTGSPFSADALVPLLAAADASWHAALGLALETAATVYEMQLDETAVVRDASIQAGREAGWRVAAASRAIVATARAAAEYVVSTAPVVAAAALRAGKRVVTVVCDASIRSAERVASTAIEVAAAAQEAGKQIASSVDAAGKAAGPLAVAVCQRVKGAAAMAAVAAQEAGKQVASSVDSAAKATSQHMIGAAAVAAAATQEASKQVVSSLDAAGKAVIGSAAVAVARVNTEGVMSIIDAAGKAVGPHADAVSRAMSAAAREAGKRVASSAHALVAASRRTGSRVATSAHAAAQHLTNSTEGARRAWLRAWASDSARAVGASATVAADAPSQVRTHLRRLLRAPAAWRAAREAEAKAEALRARAEREARERAAFEFGDTPYADVAAVLLAVCAILSSTRTLASLRWAVGLR